MSSIEDIVLAKEQRIDQLHRFQPGRTALLVVDMQRAFLEPGASLEVPTGRDILPNVRRLVETCRQRRVPVVFTQFVYATSVPCLRGDPFGIEHLPAQEGQPTGFGRPSGNCLIAPTYETGRESADIVAELAPRPDELVVPGHAYDKFYGTPLDLALRTMDIRYLIATGVVTDICVNGTILSAATREYRVTAVTDGVASPWPDRHNACLEIWRNKFARLRTAEQVIEELLSLGDGE
jgi:ureidoacrylate peracid hydrolase